MDNKTKQAMTMALKALEMAEINTDFVSDKEQYEEAITALRFALEQPQGYWVDLTDDEISLMASNDNPDDWDSLKSERDWLEAYEIGAKEAIAKFKSKNAQKVAPRQNYEVTITDFYPSPKSVVAAIEAAKAQPHLWEIPLDKRNKSVTEEQQQDVRQIEATVNLHDAAFTRGYRAGLRAQPQDMKECRHCGWLCKPNDAPSKKGYVLAQPQESDIEHYRAIKKRNAEVVALETAQPQGEWVDLKRSVIDFANNQMMTEGNFQKVAMFAFEQGLRAKKTPPAVPPVVPQGEPVAWMDAYGNIRNKAELDYLREYKGAVNPDCFNTPPSVEANDYVLCEVQQEWYVKGWKDAAEKAAKEVEQWNQVHGIEDIAAAIRGMK